MKINLIVFFIYLFIKLFVYLLFIYLFIFFSGFLITFISKPVIAGFTSAAAISIASSQLESLFGLHYESESVIEDWSGLFEHIKDTRWQDLLLGLCCIVVLLLMRVGDA